MWPWYCYKMVKKDGMSFLAGKMMTYVWTWQNTSKAITYDNFSGRPYAYRIWNILEKLKTSFLMADK